MQQETHRDAGLTVPRTKMTAGASGGGELHPIHHFSVWNLDDNKSNRCVITLKNVKLPAPKVQPSTSQQVVQAAFETEGLSILHFSNTNVDASGLSDLGQLSQTAPEILKRTKLPPAGSNIFILFKSSTKQVRMNDAPFGTIQLK